MNILAIGLDPTLLDPASVSMKRQHAYYKGHNATVVVLRRGSAVEWEERGIRTLCVGGETKAKLFLSTLYRLYRERRSYDLVIAQDVLWVGLLAYIVARLRGGKFVTQLHGDYLDNPKWLSEKYVNVYLNDLGKWLIGKSDGVRVVSSAIADYVVEKLHYPRAQVVAIPIGTELTLFQPEGVKANIPGRFVIFAQRLIPEKSPMHYVSIMIPLMRKYPDLHAVIAGVGSLRDDMNAQFRNAGLHERTHFLGQIGLAELATYYRGATCLLHTAGWEGWGMPMIEAMACGAPVVTTRTGCAGEAVIHDQNGLIFGIDDVDGMREGVDRLLADPKLQQRLSQHATTDALAWSFETLSGRLRLWYEQIGNIT